MVLAWIYDDNDIDQREPHKKEPNQPASLDQLKKIGVEYFHFDVKDHKDNQDYQTLCSSRGYSYEDVITVSPSVLPNYDQKIAMFFNEHLHTDEEIRYCLDGSGYFDVRDTNDRWIRIELHEGDLIILPAGIYHRFTVDSKNFIKAKRLFIGEPVWTPYNRPSDDMPARQNYMKSFLLCAN